MGEIRPEFWVDDVGKAMDWYERVLGFKKRFSVPGEGGKVVHGEMEIAGSNPLVFAFAQPGPGAVTAVLDKLRQGGPKGAGVLLYIDIGETDINAYFQDVQSKGAKIVEPIQDQFWGDRTFRIEDPEGFVLTFAQHVGERQPRP